MRKVLLPLSQEDVDALRAGDVVTLTGVLYTARDAAHKRLMELMQAGGTKALPIDLQGACIYYAGPCPAAPGEVLGPCGPTTSGRVDAYTPAMIQAGLRAMLGKGARTPSVKAAMKGRAVYFAATGGAAYLISRCVRSAEVVAFPELGAEAIRKLTVENLPAIVAIDSVGNDLFHRE